MIKDLVLEVTKEMPNNSTMQEILDAIIIRYGIIQGLKDIENGNYMTQEELLEEIKKW